MGKSLQDNRLKIKQPSILILFSIYFVIYAIEGVLRFYLNKIGLEFLVYTKDISLVYIVMHISYLYIFKKMKCDIYTILLFYIILYAALISLVQVNNVFQTLFGLKILLPFIAGFIALRFYISNISYFNNLFIILMFICVAGLIIDLNYNLPWTNLIYDIGGYEVTSAPSEFQAGGFSRLTGFARIWSNTAMLIMFSLIHVLFLSSFNYKYKVLYIIIALFCILITTNKGVILSSFIIVIYYILSNYKKIPVLFYKCTYALSILLTVLLPFFANSIYKYFDGKLDGIYRIAFNSLFVRFVDIWPESFVLIQEHGNIILGRGLGGIASAQKIFEPLLNNPADNYFLYLYALIGVISFIIFITIVFKVFKNDLISPNDKFFFSIIIASGFYGIIGSLIENPIFGFYVGLSYAYFFIGKNNNYLLNYPTFKQLSYFK